MNERITRKHKHHNVPGFDFEANTTMLVSDDHKGHFVRRHLAAFDVYGKIVCFDGVDCGKRAWKFWEVAHGKHKGMKNFNDEGECHYGKKTKNSDKWEMTEQQKEQWVDKL